MSLIIGNTQENPSEPEKNNQTSIESSDQNFGKDVIQASQNALIIVDFWAPSCGPCKQLTPILEKVIAPYAPQIQLVKINVEKNPMVAGQLQIQSIPAVIAFFQGRPVNGFMGALPESQIQKFIDQILTDHPELNKFKDSEESARQALENNDFETAKSILNQIIQDSPQSIFALTGLAQCAIHDKDFEHAEQYIQQIPVQDQNHADVIQVKSTLALTRDFPDLPSQDEAQQNYQKNPQNINHVHNYALCILRAKKLEEAMETLFAFFETSKNKDDKDSTRQLIVKIFQTLDAQNPLLLKYRRRLSSALFS